MMKITVFDEHHEAFLFWSKAIASKAMRPGGVLLHVDGHSDMAIPTLTRSIYAGDPVGLTQEQLGIGSFILPAVLLGFFDEVVFLSRGDKPKPRKMRHVGSLRGEGVWLNPYLKKNKLMKRLYPDLRSWHYSVEDDPGAVRARSAALDIDLDYFYGYLLPQPPDGLRLTEAQMKQVREHFTSQDEYGIELKFLNLEGGILRSGGVSRMKDFVVNSSREWIECAIQRFTGSLRTKPEVISICRSVKSGYTPDEHAAFAEETLIKYLNGRQGAGIDPCAIEAPLEIRSFIARVDDTIYNPVTDDTFCLGDDTRFIWEKIQAGSNFAQILEAMLGAYDVPRELLKAQLLKFVLRLKNRFVLR